MSEQRAPLRPHISVGTTTRFEGAHLNVEATLPAASPHWPALLEGSLRAARSIAAAVTGGERLAQAARLVRRSEQGADPWSAWLNAFAALHAVPGWSVQPEAGEGADVRLRIRCLYVQAVARWSQLALDLLIIADQARDRPVKIPRVRWAARLAGLGVGLPAPETMALHAALGARQLPWRWLGGDRTTIGLGSAQRTISGTAPDPELAADRLAQAKLSIPLYTVTGSVGKTTTTRLLAQLLETTGLRVGMTASDGAWAAGVRLAEGDWIGGMNALVVARRRDVDAMVAELGRRGLFYSGVPFERSDIAILLNVDNVHIGYEGVDTIEAMADVKGLTLRPARLAVLNRDDANCMRLGAGRAPESCVWFSRIAGEDALRALSREAGGALGVARTAKGKARALTIWSAGEQDRALPLAGVAPFHGMLGEKTLEELLAAVAAAWFGPVRIEEWDGLL
ncbi:MAG: Mur ligase family protein, partial [Sphingomonadales bacterium]